MMDRILVSFQLIRSFGALPSSLNKEHEHPFDEPRPASGKISSNRRFVARTANMPRTSNEPIGLKLWVLRNCVS